MFTFRVIEKKNVPLVCHFSIFENKTFILVQKKSDSIVMLGGHIATIYSLRSISHGNMGRFAIA